MKNHLVQNWTNEKTLSTEWTNEKDLQHHILFCIYVPLLQVVGFQKITSYIGFLTKHTKQHKYVPNKMTPSEHTNKTSTFQIKWHLVNKSSFHDISIVAVIKITIFLSYQLRRRTLVICYSLLRQL